MSTGAMRGLYRPGDSPLHRLAPQCKIAFALAFALAVVATPREAFWAFGAFAALLALLAAVAGVPPGFIARRLVIEVPLLAFAFFLPVIGQGERTEVLGLSLSVEGLWGAWNIVAKATLGLGGTLLVAATTPIPAMLAGLDRLGMPRAMGSVASFMVRYGEVIAGELRRMRIARESRGYDPRWIWQVRAVAATAGTLFIRSSERGERVYLAMVSRGYSGALPASGDAALPSHKLAAGALAALAWAIALGGWTLR
jgi:cobalt/nickel transport system permease protein